MTGDIARAGNTAGDFAEIGQVIQHLGSLIDADQLVKDIAEPLETSAPMVFQIARHTCQPGDPATDCRAYHAVWQYLRLADVIRSVRSDGALFVAAAQRLAEQGSLRRVLICGTADYSMLAYLSHAAKLAGVKPHFDVLDRCETTLSINAWYAEQHGLSVKTRTDNVLTFTPEERYDLITAHSFLAWLPYEGRAQLVKRWAEWLSPGGIVCFSNRIDPNLEDARDSALPERHRKRSEEFFARCDDRKIELPIDRQEFSKLLDAFSARTVDRKRGMPMPVLRQWLADAGLTLELAVPVAEIVKNARDRASTPVNIVGRPRIWFQVRRG